MINAIAKSNSASKAAEAESVLNRMLKSYEGGNQDAKPNTRTYSTILNACAYTNGDQTDRAAAFKIARKAFKEILSGDHGEPNQIMFATFMLACKHLVPYGVKRDQLVQFVFKECCQHGLVDIKVILNLRRVLSPSNLNEALQGTPLSNGMIELTDIPLDWRRSLQNREVPKQFHRGVKK